MKALFFLFSAGEKVKVINSADEHWWEVCVFFYFAFFLFFSNRARERLTKSSAVYSFTHARARRSRGPGL